jgi:hypothetical protein
MHHNFHRVDRLGLAVTLDRVRFRRVDHNKLETED